MKRVNERESKNKGLITSDARKIKGENEDNSLFKVPLLRMKRLLLGLFAGLLILLIPFNHSYDLSLLSKFLPEREDKDILIVNIDKEIEGGRPISHKRYAECIRRLKENGFQAIGFDVIFSEDKENDQYLAEEIKREGVYLGLPFSFSPSSSEALPSFSGIPPSNYKAIQAKGFTTALSSSVISAASIGHINLTNEKLVSGIPAAISYKGFLYPSLGLRMAAGFMGARILIEKDRVLLIKDNKKISTISLHQAKIPIRLRKFPLCSFSDVLSGNIPKGVRIAIIGGENGDFHATARGLCPGVVIIASCLSNIIKRETPYFLPFYIKAFIIIGFSLLFLFFKRISFILILLYFLTSVFLFRYAGLIFEVTRAVMAITSSLFLSCILQMAEQEKIILTREGYIVKLKKTLRYLQERIKIKGEVLPKEKAISIPSERLELTSYSQKLFTHLLKEKRIHWIDGWLVFDWLKSPPNDGYKAFLVQASKLNKKGREAKIGEILKPIGRGYYELANIERLDVLKIRDEIEKAKRLWDKLGEAKEILLNVIASFAESYEALRLLGDLSQEDEAKGYYQRYGLLIKRERERLAKVVEIIEKGDYDQSVMERRDEFVKRLSFFEYELSYLAKKGIVPKEEDQELEKLLDVISSLKNAPQGEKDTILSEICASYFFPEVLRRQAQNLKRPAKDGGIIAIGLLFELLTELDFSKIRSYESLAGYIEKALKGRIADFLMEKSGVSAEDRMIRRRDMVADELQDELGRKPTIDEICKKLGWSRDKYFEVERIGRR